jgi:hypothetical protein
MKATRQLTVFAVALLFAGQMFCQVPPSTAPPKPLDTVKNPWTFNLTTDGYIIPNGTDYASPVFSADRSWLHLEARYNDENLRTGSLWLGSTIEPDGLRSGRNWGMAMIRDRLGHITVIQR